MAENYDLPPPAQVQEALGFSDVHRVEIDAHIQAEAASESKDEQKAVLASRPRYINETL